MSPASTAPRSLRPPLALLLFALAFVASALAVAVAIGSVNDLVRQQWREDARRTLQVQAHALSDALDRGMAQHVEEMRVLAALEPIMRGDDTVRAQAVLDQFHRRFPGYAWLGLTDAAGHVIAANDGLLQGVDVSARPWFNGAQQRGLYLGDVHAAVLLAKLLPQQDEPWRFVDIALPMSDASGTVHGVLAAHLSWTWAAELKRELADDWMKAQSAEAMVLDARGLILLGPPAMQGKTFDVARAQSDGWLLAAEASRPHGAWTGLGWRTVVRQPELIAMAPWQRLHLRTLGVAFVVCLMAAPLLWWASRRLAAPLHELGVGLGVVRDAEHGPMERRPALYREADLLGQALDRHDERHAEHALRLRQLNETLEQRVVERTGELAAVNASLSRMNAELGRSEERVASILRHASDAFIAMDRLGLITQWNRAAEAIFGWRSEEAIGKSLSTLIIPPEQRAAHERGLIRFAATGEGPVIGRTMEITAQDREGRPLPVEMSIAALRQDDGYVAFSFLRDIRERRAAQQALQDSERRMAELALSDSLTGLANRRRFEERLPETLARARRARKGSALLFLDVDHFKSINDSRGHAAGDAVLVDLSRRLAAAVRTTDLVARLAGDEFVVVLEGLGTPDEADLIAEKIVRAVREPFTFEGAAFPVTTSVGIAWREADAKSDSILWLHEADEALYAAKSAGRDGYRRGSVPSLTAA